MRAKLWPRKCNLQGCISLMTESVCQWPLFIRSRSPLCFNLTPRVRVDGFFFVQRRTSNISHFFDFPLNWHFHTLKLSFANLKLPFVIFGQLKGDESVLMNFGLFGDTVSSSQYRSLRTLVRKKLSSFSPVHSLQHRLTPFGLSYMRLRSRSLLEPIDIGPQKRQKRTLSDFAKDLDRGISLPQNSPFSSSLPSKSLNFPFSAAMATTNVSIELDEVETKLRELLLAVSAYIEESTADSRIDSSPVTLRFTGGWVRDKIMGNSSHDIDVAINNMTGYQFGLKLHEYLNLPGSIEKHGIPPFGKLHKIEANPEKSKHLETTTTRIYGLDIDLVNLRKETYTDDSRNPQMEFGTAEEDALRRDATVNALFYNLNTKQVEDFTNRGLDDMESRTIRTPLAPLQTFRDDPLRVLRLIRFASRLSFTIEEECFRQMGNEEIKDALSRKISRERVGTEVTKMLEGKNPLTALQLIDEAGLYETIFTPISVKTAFKPEFSTWRKVYQFSDGLSSASANEGLEGLKSFLIQNETDRFLLWTMVSVIPWANAPPLPPTKSGRPSPPVAYLALSEGIKSPNKVADVVQAAFQNLDAIRSVKEACYEASKSSMVDKSLTSRETIGMAIRRWGPSWRNQIVFALIYEISQGHRSDQTIVHSYRSLIETVQNYKLENVCDLKRIMDGGFLAKALGVKVGPWMKEALDVVVAWQLRHPESTDTDAILEEVRNWKKSVDSAKAASDSHSSRSKPEITSELISDLVSHFLQGPIRSLFASSSTHGITPQGHKKSTAAVPPGRRRDLTSFANLEGIEEARWKSGGGKGGGGGVDGIEFGLLRWVICNLDRDRTEKNWGVLLPPVLTVLEDYEVPYKIVGCELLNGLLNNVSPRFLVKTGLPSLFLQQLLHCLTYLPELTPASQSSELFSRALPAMLSLADVLAEAEKQEAQSQHTGSVVGPSSSVSRSVGHATGSPTVNSLRTENKVTSRSVLMAVLTSGLISTFGHVGSNMAHITTVALTHATSAVSRLGIEVLPLFNTLVSKVAVSVLRDPFLVAHPPLLAATIGFVKQLVLSGWSRAGSYGNVLTMGLTVAWVRMDAEVRDLGSKGSGVTHDHIKAGHTGFKTRTVGGPRIREIVEPPEELPDMAPKASGLAGTSAQVTSSRSKRMEELERAQLDIAKTMKLLVHVVDHLADTERKDRVGGTVDGQSSVAQAVTENGLQGGNPPQRDDDDGGTGLVTELDVAEFGEREAAGGGEEGEGGELATGISEPSSKLSVRLEELAKASEAVAGLLEMMKTIK